MESFYKFLLITGVISSLAVDERQNWMVAGTSGGYQTCWDLRFQIATVTVKHDKGAAIKKVCTHPKYSSYIVSASSGNNEISLYNMESQSTQMTLWASSSPPLSYQRVFISLFIYLFI